MIAKHLLNYDLLRQLYVERNLSINEIARRQGAHPGTVYNKLKQGTLKRGETWPLRPPQPPVKKQSLIPSESILESIKELRLHGVRYFEVAEVAGVNVYTIHQHMGASRRGGSRFERATAAKLEKAIAHFEHEVELTQKMVDFFRLLRSRYSISVRDIARTSGVFASTLYRLLADEPTVRYLAADERQRAIAAAKSLLERHRAEAA